MDLFTSSNSPYYSLYKKSVVEGLSTPVNLLDPSNIFFLETNVINELEIFNKKYSRFVRCNDPEASGNVVGPVCDLINLDTSQNLLYQYNTVLTAIQDLSNALVQTSVKSGISPSMADASFVAIQTQYGNMVTARTTLDRKIQTLFDKNGNFNPTAESLDYTAIKYTNMGLTIVCVAMVYAIITELLTSE